MSHDLFVDPFSDDCVWPDDPFEFEGSAATTVTNPTVLYTPTAAWCRPGRIDIYRGSGVPIRFIQNGTVVAIDADDYEVRLGLEGSASPIRFNTANGRLVDLGGGVLSVSPTSAETEALPATGTIVIELWRLVTEDDRTIVGKAVVSLIASINP